MLFNNSKKAERLEVQIHEMILEIREAETTDAAFASSGFVCGVAATAASEHIITERRAKQIINIASQNARVRAKRLRAVEFLKGELKNETDEWQISVCRESNRILERSAR